MASTDLKQQVVGVPMPPAMKADLLQRAAERERSLASQIRWYIRLGMRAERLGLTPDNSDED